VAFVASALKVRIEDDAEWHLPLRVIKPSFASDAFPDGLSMPIPVQA
jgi:hypothetical protein